MVGRIVLALLGAVLVTEGFRVKAEADGARRTMASDPVCAVRVSISTTPRRGPTCSIDVATISRFYTDKNDRIPSDAIEVETAPGRTEWIEMAYSGAPALSGVLPGSPIVVESIFGRAASIVTSRGRASAVGNPKNPSTNPLNVYWALLAVGGLFLAIAFVRTLNLRRRPPAAS